MHSATAIAWGNPVPGLSINPHHPKLMRLNAWDMFYQPYIGCTCIGSAAPYIEISCCTIHHMLRRRMSRLLLAVASTMDAVAAPQNDG